MSKPIKLTKELKESAIAEFKSYLEKIRSSDGKVSYSKSFTYEDDDKATILFTPLAYSKIVTLLNSFDTEVAWHGCGKRMADNKYLISDIVVYPQVVTGSTVTTDEEKYSKWLIDGIKNEDERIDNIVLQGHSHVSFSTNPSTTDMEHQETILKSVADDKFYIFIIWNKKLEHWSKIFDMKTNTMYENKDISYAITSEEYDISKFLTEAKSSVETRSFEKQRKEESDVQYSLKEYYGKGRDKAKDSASKYSKGYYGEATGDEGISDYLACRYGYGMYN